jgi:Kazal-type serine protease inhibitor domain
MMRAMRRAVVLALLLPLALFGSCKGQPSVNGAAAKTAASASPAASSVVAAGGCHDNTSCAADEYCEFTPGLCGKGQSPGTCRPRPASCVSDYEPVCACSGKTYDNACAARAAGEDLAVMGGCTALIPDFAPCGAHFCDAHQSYCEIYLSDVFELPTDHFCRPLPDACKPDTGAVRGCDCFPKNTACLSFCGPLATGGIAAFHLTCQGKKPPHS